MKLTQETILFKSSSQVHTSIHGNKDDGMLLFPHNMICQYVYNRKHTINPPEDTDK